MAPAHAGANAGLRQREARLARGIPSPGVWGRVLRIFDRLCPPGEGLRPERDAEQLGQALRNVWIGNSLQMLLDRPVTMGPGLFAYSMLYPVTDNWLDDPDITPDLKRAFNERLGKRLAGFHVHAIDEREAAIDHLVTQSRQICRATASPTCTQACWRSTVVNRAASTNRAAPGSPIPISLESASRKVATRCWPISISLLAHPNPGRSCSRSGTGIPAAG